MRRLVVVLAATALLSGCAVLPLDLSELDDSDQAETDQTTSDSTETADQGDQPERLSQPAHDRDDDFGKVEVYDVGPDGDLEQESSAKAAAVWDIFVAVAGADYVGEKVATYRVGDNPDSDTMAYVYSDDDSVWTLAANLAYADDVDLLRETLIHEYSHILSLDAGQLDMFASSCATLDTSYGCAEPDSYLYGFHHKFWERYGDEAPGPDSTDEDLAWEFYQAHEDDFVNDYAATNVTEDFAESFSAFVLEDKPESTSVIAGKLLYFWSQPDLAEIRQRIRTSLKLDR